MKNIRFEIKWGFIFMIMTLLWMAFEKSMGWHDEHIEDQQYYTLIFMVPAILVYVIAFLDIRKNKLGGKMTWMDGFKSGVIITLVVTILSPLSQYITSEWITPEYFTNVIAYTVEHDMMTQEAAEEYFNLNNYILQSTLWALIMGLITSAIVALFTKKK